MKKMKNDNPYNVKIETLTYMDRQAEINKRQHQWVLLFAGGCGVAWHFLVMCLMAILGAGLEGLSEPLLPLFAFLIGMLVHKNAGFVMNHNNAGRWMKRLTPLINLMLATGLYWFVVGTLMEDMGAGKALALFSLIYLILFPFFWVLIPLAYLNHFILSKLDPYHK